MIDQALETVRQFAGEHSGHDAECERCAVATLLREYEANEVRLETIEEIQQRLDSLERTIDLWRGVAGNLLSERQGDRSRIYSIGALQERAPSMGLIVETDRTYVGGERVTVVDRTD